MIHDAAVLPPNSQSNHKHKSTVPSTCLALPSCLSALPVSVLLVTSSAEKTDEGKAANDWKNTPIPAHYTAIGYRNRNDMT